jgi:uncharacterized protein (DUF983 family)
VSDPKECPECGSARIRIGTLYANGREWLCKSCGEEFMADEPEDDDDEWLNHSASAAALHR